MKSSIVLIAAALLTVEANAYTPGKVTATSKSAKSQPGFCTKPEDCKVEGYECVALQTTRSGAEEVKQCLPKKQDSDVCSGQFPGLCPSFASWAEPYKLISSVCTYKPAEKCAKDPTGESVKGEVVCVPGAKDTTGKALEVIYGCVDIDISARKLGFTDGDDADKLAKKLDSADTVLNACLNSNASTTTSALLCSGHGTCLPQGAATLKYECRCNVGYSGDFCEKKDSNKCALPGQCSAGECNLTKQLCECPAGTTGNQCADCDASSSSACNSNGQCENKQCKCNEGFLGDHCDQKVKTKSTTPSSKKASSATAGSSTGGNTSVGSGAVSVTSQSSLAFTITACLVVAMLAIN